jgi:hypothetical protein
MGCCARMQGVVLRHRFSAAAVLSCAEVCWTVPRCAGVCWQGLLHEAALNTMTCSATTTGNGFEA